MADLLRTLSEISPELVVNGAMRYPEVPTSDVDWFETYRDQIYGYDLIIAVLDHESVTLNRIGTVRSFKPSPLWCFVPRGTYAPQEIIGQIEIHRVHFGNDSVQHIYPYDTDDDIVRMVKQKLYDDVVTLKKSREKLAWLITTAPR